MEGKLTVIDIEEFDDGSANLTLDLCPRAKELLIEAGLLSLLKKHIDELKDTGGNDGTSD